MTYYIRCADGTRWKVREAVSIKAACNEIAHARVTGSIGGMTVSSSLRGGEIVIASVVQINSDNTERKAYTQAY